MSTNQPIALVQEWIAAVNHQNRQRLFALSAPDIALVGPRGIGYGHQLLGDWLDRAGLKLITQRSFARNQCVVLAQQGMWYKTTDHTVLGEAAIATVFQVDEEQVTSFARYDDLPTALAAAGLSETDEVNLSDQ